MIKRFEKKLLIEKIIINKSSSGIYVTEILRERKYLKRGYIIRDEIWGGAGDNTLMKKMAYNLNDEYLGDSKEAYRLFKNFGITYTEKREKNHSVVTIGFSETENKWYGWSHRAICGFKIGSKCKKGDCHYQPSNKEDFKEKCLRFWGDTDMKETYKINPTAKETIQDGKLGIIVEYIYDNNIPNERMRGQIGSMFSEYPEQYGKGEWEAKTLTDAKQMAIDFSDGVS